MVWLPPCTDHVAEPGPKKPASVPCSRASTHSGLPAVLPVNVACRRVRKASETNDMVQWSVAPLTVRPPSAREHA